MKLSFSTSQFMRIVSVLGIICLLALQWVWWRSAYQAIEVNFMNNVQSCLKSSTSLATFGKLETKGKGISFRDDRDSKNPIKHAKKIFPVHSAKNTEEMEFVIEEALRLTGKQINERDIDNKFEQILMEQFGFAPKHKIQIVRTNSDIDSLSHISLNRIAYGGSTDTIYHQIGFNAYSFITVPSPIGFYVKQGAFILIVSLVLVILIGIILILQFKTMRREQKFTSFIKDYTRMMTHELKTPISGFKMVIKLLQSNPDKEVADKYLAASDNLTDRVLGNLDNILYMAMSEKRELPINRSTVKIKAFLEQIADRYRAVDYNPKIITIRTKCEPEDLAWIMDAQLMERVMNNLMDNAIKYTGEDTQIDLTCTLDGECASFCVRDNGMGISEDDQKRIYDLYERGKIAYKNHYEGYGIGLNFVHRAIKAHGGKLMMKSEIDVGTAFTIKLLPYK
jgi:two-component system phosphate regulon sensor histidine kinase PhoR